jgi:hypothetical protein
MPLAKAVKIGSQPRYWGWSDDWSALPRLPGALDARWFTERALAQLKRPVAAIPGPIRRLFEGLIVVLICAVGFPFLIVGILMLFALKPLWFLALLVVWFAGMVLLVAWARGVTFRDPKSRLAYDRWSGLRYCQKCGEVFDPRSQQVIPMGRLQDEHYYHAH